MNLDALPREFFEPSAEIVAPLLLGHWLLRRHPGGWAGGLIVETEAYLVGDPASHAYNGPTTRTRPMFGLPGHAYVYRIYGFHWCFNTVCRPAGTAEAVLIRALEPTFGEDWMRQRRPVERRSNLSSGPGKLCAALGIDSSHDGLDLTHSHGELVVARNPTVDEVRRTMGGVATTPRIGINKAADWPLRFLLPGSEFVSRKLRSKT